MRDFSSSHEWLSINTATVRQWPLERVVNECARRGIGAIAPWRDQVASIGVNNVAKLLADTGMQLSGYCRGGMFTATTTEKKRQALDDNRVLVDEAKALNAPCLILVVGGLPNTSGETPVHKNLAAARNDVQDAIAELMEYARNVQMPLAIEPLHPMYAADRACVNTLEQALDLCDALDPESKGALGVALDVYHVWWDPKLYDQIKRAGSSRLLAFHVSDWLVPTEDLLEDRGMMGDGVIDIARIRGWVEDVGYTGFSEVEIFSKKWAARDGHRVLETCIDRHRSAV